METAGDAGRIDPCAGDAGGEGRFDGFPLKGGGGGGGFDVAAGGGGGGLEFIFVFLPGSVSATESV
jgi:hypothetical protein